MATSDIDKLYGAGIRKGVPFTCPHCRVYVRWNDVAEFGRHVVACAAIELGLLELMITPQLPPAPPLYRTSRPGA